MSDRSRGSETVLDRILSAKRARLAAGEFRPRGVGARAHPSDGARFERALRGGGPSVVAEIKHRSPSAGTILEGAASRIGTTARAYRRGGASALSVVVEQDFFGGDPAWLAEAKAASGLPALMKDFVVDEVQLDFALSLGADAVLLIVAALEQEALERLHQAARTRGLAVLVEAHDGEEVRRALAAGASILGVNARDLRTFEVDLGRLERLAASIPASVVRVAESGLRGADDVRRLGRAGFGAFLVGESLLRSPDPARGVRRLRGEGTTETKVCGITRELDLVACRELLVDYVGLNFSALSPRRVSVEEGARLRRAAGACKVVAVFAGNGIREIERVAAAVGPDILQLTGPLEAGTPAFDLPIWRAVHVAPGGWGASLTGAADLFLLDSGGPGKPGGTGTTFDWPLVEASRPSRPFFLAGGLTPENVAEAVRRIRPAGVDVASGVEVAPGVKDPEKIARFVRSVRGVPDAGEEKKSSMEAKEA